MKNYDILPMTKKVIRQCLSSGQVVVLRDDPWSCIVNDLFGGLVVVSKRAEPVPTRMATCKDFEMAVVVGTGEGETFAYGEE